MAALSFIVIGAADMADERHVKWSGWALPHRGGRQRAGESESGLRGSKRPHALPVVLSVICDDSHLRFRGKLEQLRITLLSVTIRVDPGTFLRDPGTSVGPSRVLKPCLLSLHTLFYVYRWLKLDPFHHLCAFLLT